MRIKEMFFRTIMRFFKLQYNHNYSDNTQKKSAMTYRIKIERRENVRDDIEGNAKIFFSVHLGL